MKTCSQVVWSFLFFVNLAAGQGQIPKGFEAGTPAQSLSAWHIRADMQVELVAAEPLVRDPIAVAWGADGRMWVVEMGDYPSGVDGKPRGKVKILTDSKGLGRPDKMSVFLEGLKFPSAVLPWKKGALIAAAPDILYAEDTDGDGKADKVEVMFTGFGLGNPQHLVNGLRWGLDNWVHGANGDGGAGAHGTVRSLKTGKTIDIRGRNFRFRPDTGEFETTTGMTQFGHWPDDWGSWFGGNNGQPMYHFVLPEHYLKRNPHFVPPEPRTHLVTVATKLFSRARALPIRDGTPTVPPGQKFFVTGFTSACSATIYRDDLLGAGFSGNAILCDPATGLVHRQVLTPAGPTFTAQRPKDEVDFEFLASQDTWTRPTMAVAGPDGAVYIVDMYRLVIEHPQWIVQAVKNSVNLRAGEDMGRIYRLYPADKRPRAVPRLDRLGTTELVAALESPSGWQRDVVQRLLIERADAGAVGLLEKLARSANRPQTRLHALCTLEGMGKLSAAVVEEAMRDTHEGVRKNAARLTEPFLATDSALGEELVRLSGDTDAGVRLQAAFSLGEWADARAVAALVALARKEGAQPHFAAAILSSAPGVRLGPILEVALASPTGVLRDLALQAAGADGVATVLARLAAAGAAHPADVMLAAWLLDAVDRGKQTLEPGKANSLPLPESARKKLRAIFALARTQAFDAAAPLENRRAALRLLGRGPDQREKDMEQLAVLLSAQTVPELREEAAKALARLDGDRVPALLLQGWAGYPPAVRSTVLGVLLSRPGGAPALLDALAMKEVLPIDLEPAVVQRLTTHADGAVRERARKLLAGFINPDRRKLLESYQAAVVQTGVAARGGEVFGKHCASCHLVGKVGQAVGPDIAGFAQKPADALLEAVLDPNRAVEPRYRAYLAVTKDGRVFTGMLAGESAAGLTMLDPKGKRVEILRADLDELRATGLSLMPEGLEKSVSAQDLADLLAWLRIGHRPRKVIAGNTPAPVRAGPDGVLHLLAHNCAIYGDKVGLNQDNRCIAWMETPADQLVWTVDVPETGIYEVRIDWAQIDANADNEFEVQAGSGRILGKFASTGGWDKYRLGSFGQVTLNKGQVELMLRPTRQVRGELADIREVRLVPTRMK